MICIKCEAHSPDHGAIGTLWPEGWMIVRSAERARVVCGVCARGLCALRAKHASEEAAYLKQLFRGQTKGVPK